MDCLPPNPPTEMHQHICAEDFKKCPDLAQYKGSDYANAVRVERGVSLERAFEIARGDDDIDYFFYVKGGQMVLEFPPDVHYDHSSDPLKFGTYIGEFWNEQENRIVDGYCRIFRYGDAVFFNNEGKWLGTAPDLADVYEKQ